MKHIHKYKAEFNKTLPERVDFLTAMDKFNSQQNKKFDDYTHDLRKYG